LFGKGNSNWHIVQSFSGQKTQNRQQQTTEVYILPVYKKFFLNKKFRLALLILKLCNIEINLKRYNLDHAKTIQKTFNRIWPNKFRIVIFHHASNLQIVYKGEEQAKYTIPLLLHGHHFDFIASIPKMLKVCFNIN
jgi:calcineurin-like phosphoesterase family protein